jgi:hypothetical protein
MSKGKFMNRYPDYRLTSEEACRNIFEAASEALIILIWIMACLLRLTLPPVKYMTMPVRNLLG